MNSVQKAFPEFVNSHTTDRNMDWIEIWDKTQAWETGSSKLHQSIIAVDSACR